MMINTLEKVKRNYRRLARYPLLYDLLVAAAFFGRERELRKHSVEVLNFREGDTVLDIACGTGLNFPYLIEQIGPEGRVIGIDCTPEMLSAAQRRIKRYGWNNVEFMESDAAGLSLSCQVDGVISTFGVSVIPQHQDALRMAVEFLKDGRNISVLDLKTAEGFWKVLNPLIIYVNKNWGSWNRARNIPDDLEALVKDVKIEYYYSRTIFIAYATKYKVGVIS